MPKLIPLYMLSAVVIAAAGSAAFAQTTGARVGASSGASSATLKSSGNPRTAAPPSTGTSGTGGTGTGTGSTSGTTTGSSTGSTSSTGTANTGGMTAGTGSTTGTTSGTGTGSTSGTGAGTTSDTGNGSTSGLGATGSSSVNATGSTDNTFVSVPTTNPIFLNGVVGMPLLGSDVVSDDNAAIYSQNAQAAQVSTANPATVSEPTAADVSRAGASLNRVINQAARDRQKVGRNGQLLNSIAPRTSVDRSNEMPDDGPTPALKGLLSR